MGQACCPTMGEDEAAAASKIVSVATGPTRTEGAMEFTALVSKLPGAIVGLEMDFLDNEHAYICAVRPGAVDKYNMNASDPIMAGDWLFKACGTADVTKFPNKMKMASTLELVIKRTMPFTVSLDGSASLASSLKQAANGTTLMIKDIHMDLLKWNASNPAQEVKVCDRIVDVNGQTGNPTTMLMQIKSGAQLNLIINPCPN